VGTGALAQLFHVEKLALAVPTDDGTAPSMPSVGNGARESLPRRDIAPAPFARSTRSA
jgi:hypothetical protein